MLLFERDETLELNASKYCKKRHVSKPIASHVQTLFSSIIFDHPPSCQISFSISYALVVLQCFQGVNVAVLLATRYAFTAPSV